MRNRSALALMLLLTACREGPDRYLAPNPFDSTTSSGQLTWNVAEDHSPAFSADGNRIFYSARSYPGFPATESLLLQVPRTSGRAELMLSSLQRAVQPQPRFTAPAVSPDGDALAFVEITEYHDPRVLCNAGVVCPTVMSPPQPTPDSGAANTLLVRGLLRVRNIDGNGQEASVPIEFAGYGPQTRVAHPFQRQYERDRAEVFRPSWSPDGTRLVYSDGLRLLVWTVGTAAPVVIPGTADGVWPAWSPAGDVIAFTKLQRNGFITLSCDCMRIGRALPIEQVNRTIYNDGGGRVGTLMTVHPDGNNLRTLGEGVSPAWGPAGAFLVFQRGDQIYRSAPDGTGVTPIANTQFGYEPAISRDGRWLAFTRDQKQGDRTNNMDMPFDIWVLGL